MTWQDSVGFFSPRLGQVKPGDPFCGTIVKCDFSVFIRGDQPHGKAELDRAFLDFMGRNLITDKTRRPGAMTIQISLKTTSRGFGHVTMLLWTHVRRLVGRFCPRKFIFCAVMGLGNFIDSVVRYPDLQAPDT
jgi:hypothetical protein